MTPKEIHEYVKTRSVACPHCGGGIMHVSNGPATKKAFEMLINACAETGERFLLVTSDWAEADMLSHGADRLPVGVQVRK